VGVFGTTTGVKQRGNVRHGSFHRVAFRGSRPPEKQILKEIKIPDLQMKRNLYIVTHKKRSLPTAFSLFVEHILPEIKKLLKTHS
jgi:hypothetical protein